jgi:hypothetical protein
MSYGVKRKSVLVIFICFLVMGVLSACSDPKPAAQASQDGGKSGGIYYLGETVNPEQVTNFNPFLATGNWVIIPLILSITLIRSKANWYRGWQAEMAPGQMRTRPSPSS